VPKNSNDTREKFIHQAGQNVGRSSFRICLLQIACCTSITVARRYRRRLASFKLLTIGIQFQVTWRRWRELSGILPYRQPTGCWMGA
jgi:hypothetical protein